MKKYRFITACMLIGSIKKFVSMERNTSFFGKNQDMTILIKKGGIADHQKKIC